MTDPRKWTMSETELLDATVDLARMLGWRVHHDRPARTERGWRTPIQGDPGFPDLVLISPHGRILFVELKSERGKLTADQHGWIDCIGEVETCFATERIQWVWRPSNWLNGSIEAELRRLDPA